MRPTTLLLVVAQIALIGLLLPAGGSEGASILTAAKDYMISVFKDGFFKKSPLIQGFEDTMKRVQERYDEEKVSAENAGADLTNLYRKIVIQELRELRTSVEEKSAEALAELKKGETATETVEEYDIGDQFLDACSAFLPKCEKLDVDLAEIQADVQENEKLKNELDDLDFVDDAEMGWAMSEETRQAIKERTKVVLSDLLNNEIRQLATAVVTAYLTGGEAGVITMTICASLKSKVVQFFMHFIFDMINSAFGESLTISPIAVGAVETTTAAEFLVPT